ncbi:MAG TPA: FecR domain-containing protein, partial [Arachidicoccus sp.]|nr:FecR domain-containing protein [Arachidicoccus sp.]
LTLAGGRKLLLDSTASGVLALQGNLRVMALQGGLAYIALKGADSLMQQNWPDTTQLAMDEDRTALEIQNTLSTPRGARYHLTLSDGTKVWINAASSITFPVSFRGRERQVAIKGEAYFEVAKNAARPFKVTVDEMEVTVLGTHFNINAYRDESTLNTTLLEGAVKVRNLHNCFSKNIRPGQQAKLYPTDEIKVASVDTGLATAWKNGLFQFEKADLHVLLNEVSRWYNIQIEWKGTGSPDLFTGTIPRNLKLSELLSVLEYANVRFKLTSNKLIVFT